jgi:hypothetical protein
MVSVKCSFLEDDSLTKRCSGFRTGFASEGLSLMCLGTPGSGHCLWGATTVRGCRIV